MDAIAKRDQWLKDAKKCDTIDDFAAFFKRLTEDEQHDYSTICYAVSSMAIAAATITDRSPCGGITGFQAGCIMWEFMRAWTNPGGDGPMKLSCYNDMLYPQMQHKFEKTIPKSTWEYLQEKAGENIANSSTSAHPDVLAHWQSIVDGTVPFGFIVIDDSE